MGSLRYGQDEIEVDDRLLSHIQIVIAQKMRRREGFALTLQHARSGETLTSALWLSASSTVHFVYSGSRRAQTNPKWLELMMQATNSTHGLDADQILEPAI